MRRAPLAFFMLAMACASEHTALTRAEDQPKQPAVKCEDFTSIGSASMDEAGVITMDVHTLPPDPPGGGGGRIISRSSDADYRKVLNHLGPIRPGDRVNVPPWC